MIKSKVKKKADQYFEEVVKIRRHLHRYPELSYKETNTSKFIQRQLSEIGISFTSGWGEHGIVGIIKGKKVSKKVLALRADMDALPIQEANNVSYKSKHAGIMHACGHDVHSASLVGVAKILSDLRDEFGGTIKLIFQPAEEKLPGGASILIKQGVLQRPKPSLIFGQHVHPPLETGKIGFRSGKYMASCDEIYITVKGRGGHGALPHDCIDPIPIGSQLIISLQQLISRKTDPTTPAVLTFGKMYTEGGAMNVIPNQIKLEGTFRTMDEKWRKEAHQLIKKIAKNVCEGFGGKADVRIVKGYPFLINDEKLTAIARQHAEVYLGKKQIVDLPIRLTAEDFSYYSQIIPACFYRLGTGNLAKGITSPVHTDTFDVDETCLRHSIGLMSFLAIKQLN